MKSIVDANIAANGGEYGPNDRTAMSASNSPALTGTHRLKQTAQRSNNSPSKPRSRASTRL